MKGLSYRQRDKKQSLSGSLFGVPTCAKYRIQGGLRWTKGLKGYLNRFKLAR